jgi:hypothetical protein
MMTSVLGRPTSFIVTVPSFKVTVRVAELPFARPPDMSGVLV